MTDHVLSQAEIDMLPAFRDKWFAEGASTKRIDRREAEDAITEMYKAAKLTPPDYYLHYRSPLECLKARAQLLSWQKGDFHKGKAPEAERALWEDTCAQLARIGKADQPSASKVPVMAKEIWQESYFVGAMDGFWGAFYDFVDTIKVAFTPETKRQVQAYVRYALSSGWIYAYPDVVFISDRMSVCSMDNAKQLHSVEGQALGFLDGFGLYRHHGMEIPAKFIEERHLITPEMIEGERNIEYRRVLIELFGPERWLSARGGKKISSDTHLGQVRELWSTRVAGQEMRVLVVVNGTQEPDGSFRKFHLGAIPEAKTPHEAVAMSYRWDPKKYKEVGRT